MTAGLSSLITASFIAALVILLALALWHIATRRDMPPAAEYLTLAIVAAGAVWHHLVLA